MPRFEGLSEQQRKFADGILAQKTARQAHIDAGYKAKNEQTRDAVASRLLRNAKVQAYIRKRQNKAAEKAEISTASLVARLERLSLAAMNSAFSESVNEETGETTELVASKDAADIARHCTMDAAKLLGLVVDKQQVASQNVNFNVSDEPMTEDEWHAEFGHSDEDTLEAAEGATTRLN